MLQTGWNHKTTVSQNRKYQKLQKEIYNNNQQENVHCYHEYKRIVFEKNIRITHENLTKINTPIILGTRFENKR